MTTRNALVAFLMTLAIVCVSPGAVYLLSLHQIDGLPTPTDPGTLESAEIDSAWVGAREALPISVEPLSPWSVTAQLFLGDPRKAYAGQRAAWQIARAHNLSHLGNHRWWHPSGAALTIWITRHWSAEQIAATLARQQRSATGT